MLKKILILTFILFFDKSYCQVWTQAFTLEKYSSIVLHDDFGFIYSMGCDEDTCGAASGGLTVYKIRKYDPVTTTMLWNRRITSPTFFTITNAFCIDNLIYSAGTFNSSLCLDTSCLNSSGGSDIFFMTISSDGDINIRKEGGPGNEELRGCAMDEFKNIYMTGSANGQVVLGNRSYNTLGNTDLFIMKKDLLYNEIWTKIGKAVPGSGSVAGGAIQKQGNFLYLRVSGSCVMEMTTDTIGCPSSCAYYDKFDLNGNFIQEFRNIASGPGGSSTICFTDSLDNIYYYGSTYLVKSSSSGSIIWQYSIDSGFASLFAMNQIFSVIKKENKYILTGLGYYSGHNYCEYIIKGDLNTGIEEQFLPLVSPGGGFRYIKEYINNNLLYSGSFLDSIRLGSFFLTSSSWYEQFVGILDWNDAISVADYESIVKEGNVFPNPSFGIFTINCKCQDKINITIHDVFGNRLLNKHFFNNGNLQIDLSDQPKGIYFVEVLSDDERIVKKITLQ